uniref:Uncharacterized protein n=1 Tax=Anguilla anguilla TaxID=7936 RepID=A0A0E9USQ3_ANGAN
MLILEVGVIRKALCHFYFCIHLTLRFNRPIGKMPLAFKELLDLWSNQINYGWSCWI